MKVLLMVLAVVSIFSTTGCVSSKEIASEKELYNQNVPPGQCRILAQVLKIDSILPTNNGNDPCSKAPCTALVKIKNLIENRAGSVLNNGDTLKTKFAFTLNPTNKETFPTLNESLPGLTEGSTFEADIQLLPTNPSSTTKEKVYLIYGYKKIN